MGTSRKPEPEFFPEFWALWMPYRRHTDGRGLARAAFTKAVERGADPQDIVAGTKWYIESRLLKMSADERKFVPLSQTYLNRDSWEDYLQEKADFDRRMSELAEQRDNVTHFQPKGNTSFLRKFNAEKKAGA